MKNGHLFFALFRMLSASLPLLGIHRLCRSLVLCVAVGVSAQAAQVTLSWDDNDQNEDGFKIERSQGGGAYVEIASVAADTVTYTDSSVVPLTQYSYRIRAYNISGSTVSGPLSVSLAQTSAISDVQISEDTSTGQIAFTVSDITTSVDNLQISATSSNQAVIPNANIVLGGSGANRTVTITPAANANGVAIITVQTHNGIAPCTTTFQLTVSAVNDIPAVSAISNATIPEGSNTGALPFTISDAETAVGSLTVGKSSSNLTLVPLSNIVIGGSGGNRTVTVTPAAGLNGNATITITANDGELTGSSSFVLTVTEVNNAPTIAPLANRSANEDTPITFGFVVSDPDTPLASLNITGASSNQVVVPNANISFGGSGGNRTYTITPAPNQSGNTTISISVSDGSLSTTQSFSLRVFAVNDAPTISDIANQTIDANSSAGPLAFSISDVETDAASLVVTAVSSNTTVLPNSGANIVVGGSGANRTLTLIPATNKSGSTTVTVTVSDGDRTATDTFTLTVRSINTAPTIGSISAQTLTEDTPSSAIAFTVNDAETPSNLAVTAVSNNQTLLPNAGLSISGSGTTRTLVITPGLNQSGGPATVTVTVSDGIDTAQRTFNVTVTAVNDAPAIVQPSAQTLLRNTPSAPIAITISDPESDPTLLTLSASSSNVAVVANTGLALGGSGGSRTLVITPVTDAVGVTTITLTATDPNSASSSRTFDVTVTNANTAPTIAAISNVTVDEDNDSGAIAITISDAETPAGSLTLSAVSSNATLVPNANLVLAGSGGNRTLLVTPAQDRFGSSDITVTVNDGALSATRTFTFTVTAVNDAPTISDIANIAINEDSATGALPFTVSDAETPAANLVVSGTSDNPTLVPNANIVFGGAGGNRTVTVTPAANQSGTAVITILVSDGTLADSFDTFLLTVTAVNDAPTVSAIATQYTPPDTATNPIALTVGDNETAAGTLEVTATSSNQAIVSDSGILVGGAGANRTLTITPNTGQIGSVTITVRVSDQTDTTQTTFTLNVAANTAPTISAISNQSIFANGVSGPLSFIVGDLETAAGNLTLSAQSSNLTLAPLGNITFGGSGGNRTLTITPGTGQVGTANITVTVSDGALSASTGFTLTVSTAAPPPPPPPPPPTPVAPQITTQPAGVSVVAGSTISLSVVASGTPAPTYEWRKDGVKIDGATSSTLSLTSITSEQAGSYTVVVSNAAGSVTSSAATVTVRAATSSFFGTLPNGTWAMYVRSDNTATFVAYLSDRKSALVVNFTIDTNGNFVAETTETGGPGVAASQAFGERNAAAAGLSMAITGKITGSQLTGQIGGLNQSISASAQATTGPAQNLAGFYTATALGTSGGAIYTIVSASGQTFVLTTTGASVDAASGTMSSSGQFTATTSAGSALSLQLSAGAFTASYTPPATSTPLNFTGVEDTVPVTTRLVNISARSFAGSDSDTLIAGFTVLGSGTKSVLVRGAGPAIQQWVNGVLPDPQLGLFAGKQQLVSNDDWHRAGNAQEVATVSNALFAFPFTANALDAALLTNLSQGVYSAQVTGKNSATGRALVEIYDAASSSGARLVNISARTRIGTGDDVLIVGFSVTGNTPRQLLIRVIGPTLRDFDVTGVLENPQLRIVRQNSSETIAENDDWGVNAVVLRAAFTKAFAFPLPDSSKDAAVVITLQPGLYSVIASGVNNTTGVGLVEVYDLQ